MVNPRKDLEGEGDHDKDMMERINASTPSWRGWNLHLNDFGFLINIPGSPELARNSF